MKRELFNRIYENVLVHSKLDEIIAQYENEASPKIIEGVFQRKFHVLNRKSIWKVENRRLPAEHYLTLFFERCKEASNDQIIAAMAIELGLVSSCYLARLIIKAYAAQLNPRPAVISCELDDLASPTTAYAKEPAVTNPVKLFREPALIQDTLLQANVKYCHQSDTFGSPEMDKARNDIGLRYEMILEKALEATNIAYMNETVMRRMGYAKTPDIVLLEPMAIESSSGPIVIKWIESKAWFGDPESHAVYLRDQYWPYHNRFGPGLVIYWFGFVEEMVSSHYRKGIAVMDSFPSSESIVRITSPYLGKIDEILEEELLENIETKTSA